MLSGNGASARSEKGNDSPAAFRGSTADKVKSCLQIGSGVWSLAARTAKALDWEAGVGSPLTSTPVLSGPQASRFPVPFPPSSGHAKLFGRLSQRAQAVPRTRGPDLG